MSDHTCPPPPFPVTETWPEKPTKVRTYRLPEVRVMTVREDRTEQDPIMNRADVVARVFNETVLPALNPDVEHFIVLMLNRRNGLKGYQIVTTGTATSCLAHPREVFRAAIVASAAAIVCIHNHPSGDPAPSAADIQLTRQLREAAQTVDIGLLDHVIVGEIRNDPMHRGFYSFREAGLL